MGDGGGGGALLLQFSLTPTRPEILHLKKLNSAKNRWGWGWGVLAPPAPPPPKSVFDLCMAIGLDLSEKK